MRIQHNIMAMSAYRNYTNNVSAMKKNLEKLSSGYKINRAGDDAAGLAISEKMRAQITGLQTAQKNAKDGISLVQTAEGALTEVHDILNRMVELATQSANGTYDNTTDRAQMEKELNQLKSEIDRIADASNFNGIKLLDGSLGESTSKAMELNTLDAVDMTDGITINAPVDGAGQTESKTWNFSEDAMFGTGDKLELTYTDNTDPNAPTAATVTLTFGAAGNTGIAGTSLENQISSIVSGLEAVTAISDKYVITAATNADGKAVGIKFEAKAEGVPDVTIDSLKVTDKQITAAIDSTTPGANATSATTVTALERGWENAFGPAAATGTIAATDISVGDKIQANFVVNGTTMTVTLEAVAEGTTAGTGQFALGTSISATVANLVSAMQNASFDDSTATAAIDESLMKVSDFFSLSANVTASGATGQGSIKVAASSAAPVPTATGATQSGAFTSLSIGDLSIKRASAGTAGSFTTVTAAAGTAGAYTYTTGAASGVFNAKIDNMAAGDSFTINGTLRDGRTFSITLTEGEEFTMGASAADTISAIAAALAGTTAKVSITNPATNESVSVTANEVFGSGKEFTLGTASAASGLLTFTAAQAGAAGKGVAGSISSVVPSKANELQVTEDTDAAVPGKAPSTSENTMSFDPAAIEQGTTITIDGKTYEFVDAVDAAIAPTAGDTTDGISGNLTSATNVAVAVTGLNAKTASAQDIANALKNALGGGTDAMTAANGQTYKLETAEGKLTIKSDGAGTGKSPLEVQMGASKPTSSLTFVTDESKVQGVMVPDTKAKVKVGDTVTINGKVYEFVDDKRTKNEDAIGVSIKDIKNADGSVDADRLATRLAEAVNMNDDKIIARADGKSVIFTSEYNSQAAETKDSYKAPSIELPKSFNSLSLQIGDTADSYNQLSVSINDCHVDSLGLNNVTIADQDSARAAIQTIRDAINKVSDVRGTLGATQNRLDHTINNLSVMTENIQDAESSIRDVDVAEEMMAYTKNNILIQSAQAMLAQANQVPQGVLQLLQ